MDRSTAEAANQMFAKQRAKAEKAKAEKAKGKESTLKKTAKKRSPGSQRAISAIAAVSGKKKRNGEINIDVDLL